MKNALLHTIEKLREIPTHALTTPYYAVVVDGVARKVLNGTIDVSYEQNADNALHELKMLLLPKNLSCPLDQQRSQRLYEACVKIAESLGETVDP